MTLVLNQRCLPVASLPPRWRKLLVCVLLVHRLIFYLRIGVVPARW